jgi:hypothetical protein
MIIANIIGGLGNQMFQYACARSMSLRTGLPLLLAIDQLPGYASHNGFELQRVFQVGARIATQSELRTLLGWQAPPRLRRILGRPRMRWAVGRHWCNEPHFQFWHSLTSLSGSRYLHGYWQSERYFMEYADQIRADFTFQLKRSAEDEMVLECMRTQPSVSLHVRRGDYTNKKNQNVFALCDLNYYRNAIRLMRGRVPGLRLFAFSDDPDWVEAQFAKEFGPIELVRHNVGARSANDMWLMSQADHHIIANSSFSWWGAWLNQSSSKIVVSPRSWFINGTDDRDLIPARWIRI